MKILVTGGAGYIGSVAVEQLISAGESVVVLDNLCQGHRQAVHPQATLVVAELENRQAIDEVMTTHRPDAVMHFASHTLVGESMQQPFRYLGTNVVNGLNLLQSMAEHGVRRFILSSTANLFDQPERMPIDETERIVPGSPYGESKYMLERLLPWLEKIYGMRYAMLRYFNAAGATPERGEDHNPELHLIPIVLGVALGQRESVTIFGEDYPTPDGTCVRDYIHVSDLARAHILALAALEKESRVYNLGNGRGYSVRQVIETARRLTGHAIPALMGSRRAGDPAVLVGSSRKIERELGWRPQFDSIESIVESAWRWHQRFPKGYQG
ncbi:MAG: UDP-glucose 4-epimerase GalE [Planctomycetes bacterium]|nr:UDP-glucose 4-epimerase GalE [Planctomycetota bacterium]